jgi:hypothetical protein
VKAGGAGCVDENWLETNGFESHELVHNGGILKEVLCPGHPLPCGTEHHAISVDGKEISYGEHCSVDGVQCSRAVMRVNTVWATHAASRNGVDVDLTMKVFMHDVRYPFFAQYVLHSAMQALRAAKNDRATVAGSTV